VRRALAIFEGVVDARLAAGLGDSCVRSLAVGDSELTLLRVDKGCARQRAAM
jgi:hypothetical protein